jgi:hypothetical protein
MRIGKRLIIPALFGLWTGLSILGARAYYHKPEVPLDMNMQYLSNWGCIQGRCGVLIVTPEGPMVYEVPDHLHKELYRLYLKKHKMTVL